MSGATAGVALRRRPFGLVVSALVCVYLVYALLRGENL